MCMYLYVCAFVIVAIISYSYNIAVGTLLTVLPLCYWILLYSKLTITSRPNIILVSCFCDFLLIINYLHVIQVIQWIKIFSCASNLCWLLYMQHKPYFFQNRWSPKLVGLRFSNVSSEIRVIFCVTVSIH